MTLPYPSRKVLKSLSDFRQHILTALYYLSINDEGVGFADPKILAKAYKKICAEKFTEGEWFALENQAQLLFNACDELYSRGAPTNEADIKKKAKA